jgi:hypothetical protein
MTLLLELALNLDDVWARRSRPVPARPPKSQPRAGSLCAREGWLRRPTPPSVVKPGGAASLQLIFRRRAGSPWSWHQFGRVGPDGCPGFKGPFPQPVSMSGAKFRCDSTLAQGTSAQSIRSPRGSTSQRTGGAVRHPRTRSAPKNAVNPSLGAPAAPSMARTVFGALLVRRRRRRGRLCPIGCALLFLRLRRSFQCINVLSH